MSSNALAAKPSSLEQARHHHAQGHLLEAAEAYRQFLESGQPPQLALLGLSLIARQSNQPIPALRMAQAALKTGPTAALAWANFGDILTALNQLTEAQSAYCKSIALDPATTAAHYGLGNIQALQEHFAAALASFATAASQSPNFPDVHFAVAFAHSKLGNHLAAIHAYRRAVELRPAFAAAWLNLGVELVADGRDQLAALCYLQALSPPASVHTQISAHLNHGHLERARKNFPQALNHYNHALAAKDHSRLSEVHVAFAYYHLEQQQFTEAHQSIAAATAADPAHENSEIPNALGILLLAEEVNLSARDNRELPIHRTVSPCDEWEGDHLQRAIHSFLQAESLGHKTAASNRGNALLSLGRTDEALAAHQRALDRDPTHPGVRYNLALTQLRLGDYQNGWGNYEARWNFREVHPHPRRFPQPRWRGESLPLPNSTLFLYAEQGLGDTIQFIRYMPLVAARLPGIKILIEVQPSLIRLLNHNFTGQSPAGLCEFIAHGTPLSPFTHHCPLLSLPAVFHSTLATIPARIPYLTADPELVMERSRELKLLDPSPMLRIGINWAGNPSYRADHERSTHLKTFSRLLDLPHIQFISLQKGEAASELYDFPHIYDASSHDEDFAATAALIANLDLVITTDTAVAHLAGALGKPLWLLLPWQSDWRWMQHRLDTPWYPTARLFRQRSPHNWPELIDRVVDELRASPDLRANSLTRCMW